MRALGFSIALDRVRAVLALVVGGALASTAVSATNGVTVVTIAGAREESLGSAWLLWWLGDAIGVLMVAPPLSCSSPPAARGRRGPASSRASSFSPPWPP